MKVNIEPLLSDNSIASNSRSTQRQLTLNISALADKQEQSLPLNLCLIIDCSGSMAHEPLETVKKAAISIIEKLHPAIAFPLSLLTIRQKPLFLTKQWAILFTLNSKLTN